MRIFVTGATGFIGTKLVKELIEAGHKVRGLTRSDAGAEKLRAAGAEVHRGNIEDLESLRNGATGMDAVINLAFDHDMSNFAENSQNEMKAIETLGATLQPGKVLLVTSGVAIVEGEPGHVRTEGDPAIDSPAIPRKGEQAARAVAERGVHVGVLRMSQVHDTYKQGLVTFLISDRAREGRLWVCWRWWVSMGSGAGGGRGAPVSASSRRDSARFEDLSRGTGRGRVVARYRGSHRQRTQGAGRFHSSGEGCRPLRNVRAVCDL